MKSFLLLFLGIFAACSALAQTQVYSVQAPIVRHKGGNPDSIYIYTDLDVAISAAMDNDVYYLAGGNYSVTSTVLNKKIIMYGTGYRNDTSSTMRVTVISSILHLGINSKGSLFYGIDFRGGTVARGNIADYIYFNRCNIAFWSSAYSSEHWTAKIDFNDCIIGSIYTGVANYNVIVAHNCVFEKTLDAYYSNRYAVLMADNCIFLGFQTGGYNIINGFQTTIVRNSIILLNTPTGDLISQGTPSDIRNCLIVGEANRIGTVSTTMNIRKDPTFKDSIFVNRTDLFDENANYNLKSNLQDVLNNNLIYNKLGIYRNLDGSDHLSFGKATPPVHIVRRDLRFSMDGRSLLFTGRVIDGN
jgi:hypothetical protein